ncbi:MAG: (2Fe-2S)-binding protein [Spirochaetes bacterium]|nr:(2Fe-2S)-binding protein [Spirochaetota bacterium]
MRSIKIQFTVNDKKYYLETDPMRPLSRILRDDLLLTGTKIGCDKGECGACTVIFNDRTVDSCLIPAVHVNKASIITIEGIGKKNELHPIQEAFIEEGAIQCGFCTPGLIISAYDLLQKNADPSNDEIKDALSGNLCRCTGYVKIIKAVKNGARSARSGRRGK